MNKIGLVVAAAVLTGCAAQIMSGYVGKDVTDVALDYGPPVAAFDLPDGRRAFQWKVDSVTMMPTQTTVTGYGSGNWYTADILQTGGGAFASSCIYTMFGQKNASKSYTITGYKEPTLGCM